jgi:UDP-N-acetylmuramate dehydrogenase
MSLDARLRKKMRELAGKKIFFDVPMRQYTTLRAGGNAEALYMAGNREKLQEMILLFKDEGISYLMVGKGSNLLVEEEGLKGVAIIFEGPFCDVEQVSEESPYVLAGAGLSLQKLVSFCTKKGLSGAEFLAGIPGSLGGAVAMNAGSWGQEIKDIISEVTILSDRGITEKRDRSSLDFTYRGLELSSGTIILNAGLRLRFDEIASIRERVMSNIERRKERFPMDMPSAGSVFKNPEGDYAGRLIEAAGLKGKKIGGAMISDKHANFIVNTGNASASDITALMDLAGAKVKDMFNIQLVPEIKIAGRV